MVLIYEYKKDGLTFAHEKSPTIALHRYDTKVRYETKVQGWRRKWVKVGRTKENREHGRDYLSLEVVACAT